jgi:hypothetical protein
MYEDKEKEKKEEEEKTLDIHLNFDIYEYDELYFRFFVLFFICLIIY